MRLMRILVPFLLLAALAACKKGPDPEFVATCHGPPLKGAEEHEKAMQEGYDINPKFKCITIESYAYVETRKKLDAEAKARAKP